MSRALPSDEEFRALAEALAARSRTTGQVLRRYLDRKATVETTMPLMRQSIRALLDNTQLPHKLRDRMLTFAVTYGLDVSPRTYDDGLDAVLNVRLTKAALELIKQAAKLDKAENVSLWARERLASAAQEVVDGKAQA
jgi:hypothetical protein